MYSLIFLFLFLFPHIVIVKIYVAVWVVDFMLNHESNLKTHTKIMKTSGFSKGCRKSVGKFPERTVQYSVADTALPDWGGGLRWPGDWQLGQEMFKHPSLQILQSWGAERWLQFLYWWGKKRISFLNITWLFFN